jgi:hypothetical protein
MAQLEIVSVCAIPACGAMARAESPESADD